MPSRIPTLLITGTAGVGKTAVAEEVGELLRLSGVAHAVIDLDALAKTDPPAPGGGFNSTLIAENLASIWPTTVRSASSV